MVGEVKKVEGSKLRRIGERNLHFHLAWSKKERNEGIFLSFTRITLRYCLICWNESGIDGIEKNVHYHIWFTKKDDNKHFISFHFYIERRAEVNSGLRFPTKTSWKCQILNLTLCFSWRGGVSDGMF